MGGGGDGGYQARQDAQDAQKQQARNALNTMFGIAPPAPPSPGQATDADGNPISDPGADAAAAFGASQGNEAAANKSALDQLYGTVRTNAYNAGKRGIDEGHDKAARDLKFELFARGLNGGQVDIDENALLGRKYTDGLTQLGAKADDVATNLRTGDESSRLGLLQSIDNGMDQGSAISSALAQLQNNSSKAASAATGTDLGDLFTGAGLLYDQGRKAQGQQTAADYYRTLSTRPPVARSNSGTTTWAGS